MSLEVLAKLKSFYPSYTPVERDIANYILAHGEEVVFMSITELAQRCSVCETSIVRFCRHIGQPGYQVFRVALASALEAQRQQFPKNAQDITDPFEKMLETSYEKYLYTLKSTRHMLAQKTLSSVAEQLEAARQLYCFAAGLSVPTATYACQFLLLTMGKGFCATDPALQAHQAKSLSKGDVAFFFSFYANNDELTQLAMSARNRGAFTIALTSCGDSSLNKACDISLCCGYTADPAHSSEMDRLTVLAPTAYILEVICETYQSLRHKKEPAPETDKSARCKPQSFWDIYLPMV